MADASVLDMRDIVVSNHSFGPSEIRQICTTISEDYSQLGILRDAVTELAQGTERSPAQAVRLGVSQYLLGKFS
ncbi:MAG: hypothetical protein KDA51_12645 [Planctomycetales bacterium]|nr:hypothetical protein [Planctomycetales bacterium]